MSTEQTATRRSWTFRIRLDVFEKISNDAEVEGISPSNKMENILLEHYDIPVSDKPTKRGRVRKHRMRRGRSNG